MSSFLKNPTVQVVMNYFPTPSTILLATLCFALGMVWAYGVRPVRYVNGSPAQLEQSFQEQWVLGAAARLAELNSNNPDRVERLLEAVDDPTGIAETLRADPAYSDEIDALNSPGFQQLLQQAQPDAAETPPPPSIVGNYLVPLIVVIIFAILFVLAQVLWTLLIYPFIEPILAGRNKGESSREIDLIKQRNAAMDTMRESAVADSQYGTPVKRELSMYREGYGNYDDSFNIETDAGMYYGEMGGAVAETVEGDGVTAIEVWMFDKDEFTNTPTAIFATEYAFNDPAIRSRLDIKGDVIKLEKGNKAVLETDGIYMEAIVREIDYKEGVEQPNSVIDESTIEVIAWSKNDATGPTSSNTISTPEPAAMPQAQTTPTSETSQTPLSPPPMQTPGSSAGSEPKPLSPPPMQMPTGGNDEPDRNPPDPFGGAGDFRPPNQNT